MKHETHEYATEIRLNRYGMIDVDYYRHQALQMRAECTAEMFAYAKDQFKVLLDHLLLKLIGSKVQTSH